MVEHSTKILASKVPHTHTHTHTHIYVHVYAPTHTLFSLKWAYAPLEKNNAYAQRLLHTMPENEIEQIFAFIMWVPVHP